MGCGASLEVSIRPRTYAAKSEVEDPTCSTLHRTTTIFSMAETAVEPSNFVKSVKIKMKNFQSYMTDGINNEADQFQDEVAQCTGTFTSSDKQRVMCWLHELEDPSDLLLAESANSGDKCSPEISRRELFIVNSSLRDDPLHHHGEGLAEHMSVGKDSTPDHSFTTENID